MKKKILYIAFNILFCMAIFSVVFSGILKDEITDLDELWNYNTARAIMHGLIPYKEISMITTPLLPFIVSIILKIFGDKLVVFRIVGAILLTAIFFLSYVLSYKLTKRRSIGVITSLTLILLYKNELAIDYNYFILMIMMCVQILEVKKIESIEKSKIKNKKINMYDVIIGILLGLAICTKQTIGTIISITVILLELILVENKQTFLKYIKASIVKIISMLSVVMIFLLYLLITNSMTDFINYAILGIRTFTNKIEYKKLFTLRNKTIVGLAKAEPMAIALMMTVIGIIKTLSIICKTRIKEDENDKSKGNAKECNAAKNKTREDQGKEVKAEIKKYEITEDKKHNNRRRIYEIYEYLKKYIVIFIAALGMLITMYPISDEIHFMIAIMPIIVIEISIFLDILTNVASKDKSQISNFMLYALEAFLLLFLTYKLCSITYKWTNEYQLANKEQESSNFEYIPLYKETSEGRKEIADYIKDKREQGYTVHILDSDAVVYSILTNNYAKNYDMLLKGNIGTDGAKKIMQDIDNCKAGNEKILFLLKKRDRALNWQSEIEVINYARENLIEIDEIGIYDVLSKE